MRRPIFLLGFAAALLTVNLCISSGVYRRDALVKRDFSKELELFEDALSIVQKDYVDADKIELKKLIYGALKGMLSDLDPYSQFMEPDEFKELKAETQGEFGGIGVEISIKDGLLTVISPIDGTPAQKAGIKAGDKINSIDGKSTKDMRLDDAVKKLRGRSGTSVKISVIREEENKLLDFTITRSIIKVDSIKEAKIIDDKEKIGYIKLVEFQQRTPADLDSALKKLKVQGAQALILDLRNNPGGLLDAAIEVSERFIPKDEVIVSTKGKLPSQNAVFTSQDKGLCTDIAMIVLVNKGSASGSEIVAGAVQDNKRGLILGEKTFGKGSVQTVMPLKDGSALRLTTAKYYTPNNRIIHDEGIVPDVVMEQEKEIKDGQDSQLLRAVDLLKGIKAYEKISG